MEEEQAGPLLILPHLVINTAPLLHVGTHTATPTIQQGDRLPVQAAINTVPRVEVTMTTRGPTVPAVEAVVGVLETRVPRVLVTGT